MKNLQEATERICELKGSLIALDVLMPTLIDGLPRAAREGLAASFEAHAEAARTVLLHADISDLVLAAFERDVLRLHRALQSAGAPQDHARVDPLMLATTRVETFAGAQALTSASGFFFRRDGQLFLVSNRHVFADPASAHSPDRVEIGMHTDAQDLTRHVRISLPLHLSGQRLWREALDSGGAVDVAVLEVPPGALPPGALPQAFDLSHLDHGDEAVGLGDTLSIVGFPLGFHDTRHHLAVARSASIASAYGVRFQGQGCFLTDARTHRGSSGAPVLRRRHGRRADGAALPWLLLGVHSTRLDVSPRDQAQDESLGLNGAWYADVLRTLTQAPPGSGEGA